AARHICARDRHFREDGWNMRERFDKHVYLLEGKTALVLGFGAIGSRVARILRAVGMEVIATRRSQIEIEITMEGVELHPPNHLDELLPRANALIICLP